MIKAALFDLDGVVLDTETQYTKFWESQFHRYYSDSPGIARQVKGMTLRQVHKAYFADRPDVQQAITQSLNDFEQQMSYEYIPGFETFVRELREQGIRTAVVTSSNRVKMENVYRRRPALKTYFDRILTSEDFSRSKPDPDGYLKGAAALGVAPAECLGFEDSINGLKAARAAGLLTVGLTTTNPYDVVAELCDVVVDNFTRVSLASLSESFPG